MATTETAEGLSLAHMYFLFHFPIETPENDRMQAARVTINHLYDGVGELKTFRFMGKLGIATTVAAGKPLAPDDQLSDEDVYARALIGTHLELVGKRVLAQPTT